MGTNMTPEEVSEWLTTDAGHAWWNEHTRGHRVVHLCVPIVGDVGWASLKNDVEFPGRPWLVGMIWQADPFRDGTAVETFDSGSIMVDVMDPMGAHP